MDFANVQRIWSLFSFYLITGKPTVLIRTGMEIHNLTIAV
jgi:hypothetical protein